MSNVDLALAELAAGIVRAANGRRRRGRQRTNAPGVDTAALAIRVRARAGLRQGRGRQLTNAPGVVLFELELERALVASAEGGGGGGHTCSPEGHGKWRSPVLGEDECSDAASQTKRPGEEEEAAGCD